MTALDTTLRSLRTAALRTERQAQRAILAAWSRALTALTPFITTAIAQAIAAQSSAPGGASIAIASLPAVRALAAAFGRELPAFGIAAAVAVQEGARAAGSLAPELAGRAILAALGTPPPGALVPHIVTSVLFVPNENAAQIAATIARLAPGLGDAGAKAIADGVRRGLGPRAIAREVQGVARVAPQRALIISRTTVNEGFRRASLATMRQNAGVLEGWVWVCAQSRRTCAACWAKHGSFHPLDEPMATHPCCRCAMAPRTKSWEALGFPGVPDTRPENRDGAALFTELSEEDQRFILGPGKFGLWQSGAITLADLAVDTFSAVYGRGMREAGLRELRGAA